MRIIRQICRNGTKVLGKKQKWGEMFVMLKCKTLELDVNPRSQDNNKKKMN